MKNKIVVSILSLALVFSSVNAGFAQTSDGQLKSDSRGDYAIGSSGQTDEKNVWPETPGINGQPGDLTGPNNEVNEKFRSEILRLAADAKTAAIPVKIPSTRIQSQHKNNLSRGGKIAIGVAVAVGVVVVILLVKRCRNEMGCGAGQ